MIRYCVLAALLTLATSSITVDPKSRFMKDEQGRTRIFHGYNVVVKRPDYLPW